jgi:FkbM family methyltransferase
MRNASEWALYGWSEIVRRVARPEVTEKHGIRLALRDPAISPAMHAFLVGGYEHEVATLAPKWIKGQDSVLELGGAVGFVAMFCLKKLGVRNYAVVEANPRLKPLMQRNFALNDLDLSQVTLINAAVVAEDGPVEFGLNKQYWASTVFDVKHEAERITLPGRSIPTILAELPFRPNVLIMDIEGVETTIDPAVLRAFETVILEPHPLICGKGRTAAMFAALERAGMRIVDDHAGRTFVLKRTD